jgi:hypothetical protein
MQQSSLSTTYVTSCNINVHKTGVNHTEKDTIWETFLTITVTN